jgi:hypothetical protein
MFRGRHLFPIRATSLAMVPDKGPFQRTIFPAATARHGELDSTTTGEATRRPAYVRRAGGLHHKGPGMIR